jgi:hypothetical protein
LPCTTDMTAIRPGIVTRSLPEFHALSAGMTSRPADPATTSTLPVTLLVRSPVHSGDRPISLCLLPGINGDPTGKLPVKLPWFALPPSCTAIVPRQAQRSWGLPRSGCGGTSPSRPRLRATTGAEGRWRRGSADDRRGSAESGWRQRHPASLSFSFDCNPFTALVKAGASTSGCGTDPRFKIQDENGQWCSDFAKWVWEQGGVTADLGTLTGQSATFYQWALDQGQHPAFDSGTPQIGDAVVFYPGPIRRRTPPTQTTLESSSESIRTEHSTW